jgi:NitT/TauT family transport system ATP-binding protein
MTLIELSAVSKRFTGGRGDVLALDDIDLTVHKGEFVALLGPSGCGKSTLLRLIGGLHAASAGEVRVAGEPVTEPTADVGMVFQKAVLLEWRTVLDNVLVAARLRGLPAKAHRERAWELLRLVGLEKFADRYPRELSGGMQQRVALCRALLLEPPLLLMDEPFGALDAMTRDEMNFELARIVQAARGTDEEKTVVFVTHSVPEAVLLSDRIVVLSAHPGSVRTVIDVDLPRPRDVRTRAHPRFGELTLSLYEAMNVAGVHGVRD